MLSCKQFTELVTDHLEGQLPLAERVSVPLHLGSCQPCRAYLGQMKSLLKLLRQLPVDPSPPRVSASLLISFREMTRT